MAIHNTNTVDTEEIAKFEAMADAWWDEAGPFKPLHKFNPVRIAYLRDRIAWHFDREPTSPFPLQDITILDVGCGGGLLAEPLKRMGASVTGIDASEKNIRIASLHATKEELDITYICSAAEALADTLRAEKNSPDSQPPTRYDVVIAMEIIEHVADVPHFIKACTELVNPGGLLFIATLNRTFKSLALAKFGAEYILRWLPAGTHDWQKFLKPSEIERTLRICEMSVREIQGVSYNPIKDRWKLSANLDINYMIVAEKTEVE